MPNDAVTPDVLSGSPARFPTLPLSRGYVHIGGCGGGTEVGDWAFEAICDPFYSTSGTICAACGQARPLREYQWSDTGENVQGYRNRLAPLVPPGYALARRRFLIQTVIVLIGAAVGAVVSGGKVPAIVAGAAGGIALAFVYAALSPKVPKIDFRWYV